jgi:hypothetical protein
MATQQPSAVRFFAVDHPAVAGTVRERLEKRRKDLVEELAFAKDWGDYSRRAGRLEGIDNAIQHCIDVETESQERNRE